MESNDGKQVVDVPGASRYSVSNGECAPDEYDSIGEPRPVDQAVEIAA